MVEVEVADIVKTDLMVKMLEPDIMTTTTDHFLQRLYLSVFGRHLLVILVVEVGTHRCV